MEIVKIPFLSRTTRFMRPVSARGLAVAILAASLGMTLAISPKASAQADSAPIVRKQARLVIPPSSESKAADTGIRAHTNVRLVFHPNLTPNELPPFSGEGYETPASLACIYLLASPIPGCNPNLTTKNPDGGSESIAIVDAYDDPNAASDLQAFSGQFGLPFNPNKFSVVYASGAAPATDPTGGWELEESLDIEYAHAMAPHAKIYLVETASNSFVDLFTGVQVAANLVRCGNASSCPASAKGKGEVSMSWGGNEFPQETQLDGFFVAKGVVFVASIGDSPGVIYPGASPNVIAAGGTTTARSLETGNLKEEIAWSDAGGGASQYEPLPNYQSLIAGYAGTTRATPDISTDANPNTGVWIFDSFPYQGIDNPSDWWVVGGTSAAAPTIAGILNAAATSAGKFPNSTAEELTRVYNDIADPFTYFVTFKDITYGACNYYSSTFSRHGYDFCTGVGSPRGLLGK